MEGNKARDVDTLAEGELKDLIRLRTGSEKAPQDLHILTDTTDFLHVEYGDVVLLEERPYLIRNNEREGRFGLDDEPKFWVKRSIDLLTGEVKVIKLGFREQFQSRVGGRVFDFIRSPGKEARILDLVRGHRHFMEGFAVRDEAGNTVRIIDFIRGPTLAEQVLTLGSGHEDYFFNHFARVFRIYLDLVEAIAFLHRQGEKHGDIRRDHIIVDIEGGFCRWIDFDYTFTNASNPYQYDLFGLGNVLVYLAGRGDVTVHELKRIGDSRYQRLEEGDLNIIFRNRVVNLRKIHPYIPEDLNRILLHFSSGAEAFYETVDEYLEDLRAAESRLGEKGNAVSGKV